MGLVWRDPPNLHGRRTAEVLGWVEELRSEPGKWAVWPTKTSAGVIRKGNPGFEAVSRKCEDGVTRTFVRYVGEPAKLAAVPDAPTSPDRVLGCETCGFEVDVDQQHALAKHVTANHARKLSALERTPRKPAKRAAS